ncbi:DedA family protein [Planococcus halotolerans]|uniref:TVP38/TMEM64 family membrane protein n=1 Tax=Planococcus halotolerans TaxID=2233542 RepID=A0A365L8B1_9BACL|nr:DedA family protein [Planococcus halotolerans]RAZ81605.1 DedA family protein [Planococcus halotolerans]
MLLNLGVGAIGFFPSFLVTGLNVSSFGITLGTVLSLSGEIFGAIAGFYLYRFGFKKMDPGWLKHRFWTRIQTSSTSQVFWTIILLRLIPFVPSGLVTAGASLTSISGPLFIVASTIGKIPAVFIEVAVVYGLIHTIPVSYQYSLAIMTLVIVLVIWTKSKRKIQM